MMPPRIELARPRVRDVEHDVPRSRPRRLRDMLPEKREPRVPRRTKGRRKRFLPRRPTPVVFRERCLVPIPKIHPVRPETQMHALNPDGWEHRSIPRFIQREFDAIQAVALEKRRQLRRIPAEDVLDFP